MQQRFSARKTVLAVSIGLALGMGLFACGGGDGGDGASNAGPNVAAVNAVPARTVVSLNQKDWSFMLDAAKRMDNKSAAEALADGGDAVTLPHTWNATDGASTSNTTPCYRGIGWYRLDFNYSGTDASQWLQFDGASIVADVWLNGVKLGTHSGAFAAFRFDVSALLKTGTNTLVVKVNNSAAAIGTDPTAIAPLSGDFNMSGGLYRGVSLVSTPNAAHIALNDLGSTGVYARTTTLGDVTNSGSNAFASATVDVNTKLSNGASSDSIYTVRVSLLDGDGKIVGTSAGSVTIKAGSDTALGQQIKIGNAHLWNGVKDPYLYTLVVDLLDGSGNIVDKVVQKYGIRTMSFDANKGFSLNGKLFPLRGVNTHQDMLGKAWAISDADIDGRLTTIVDVGANTLRMAHYQHADYAYATADKLGLVVWAENGFVNQTLTAADCKTRSTVPASFSDNLKLQTQEMVRQNFNHASIGMWSIANEVGTNGSTTCLGVDTVTPMLKTLQTLVKAEDPSRVTTLADSSDEFPQVGTINTGGITDVWAINRYHGWYFYYLDQINTLGAYLDKMHAKYPTQPMGISEYGAGAALSHQTDNPLGGVVASMDTSTYYAPSAPVINYQPEGYASFVHEQYYAQASARQYIWGTYLWNMFDFGSGTRNEGDVRGVNTKGLVTFDGKTKKDPYYFYQAAWRTDIPVVHINGSRYTNRAYKVADVRVYSNADSTTLTLNGTTVGTMTAAQCTINGKDTGGTAYTVPNTCEFKNVVLAVGSNSLVATGARNGKSAVDEVSWTLGSANATNVYIAAGEPATGLKQGSTGRMFGSDNFFTGGTGTPLIPAGSSSAFDLTEPTGFSATDMPVWRTYRVGSSFQYNVPVVNGTYAVTLGFVEPTKTTAANGRVFNVTANGGGTTTTPITSLNVLSVAGAYRKAYIAPSFNVTVSNGLLNLTFTGTTGEAVVSNITIVKQ